MPPCLAIVYIVGLIYSPKSRQCSAGFAGPGHPLLPVVSLKSFAVRQDLHTLNLNFLQNHLFATFPEIIPIRILKTCDDFIPHATILCEYGFRVQTQRSFVFCRQHPVRCRTEYRILYLPARHRPCWPNQSFHRSNGGFFLNCYRRASLAPGLPLGFWLSFHRRAWVPQSVCGRCILEYVSKCVPA